MRWFIFAIALFTINPWLAHAANIVLSNDDGWAEINIREAYKALTCSGHSVILSAPAFDQSGKASRNAPPRGVHTIPCEFCSCPANSPGLDFNTSEPRWNYVNSYPVTAVRYGIQKLSHIFFSGPSSVDLVVMGPNVVGAAVEAGREGIPSVAFSGFTGTQTPWNVDPVPEYATIYAELTAKVTDAVLASGTPYLPPGTWLSVNFPGAGPGTNCTSASQVNFALTRLFPAVRGLGPLESPPDVTTCDNGGVLPSAMDVIYRSVYVGGCAASISVGNYRKVDATRADQEIVLQKLGGILSCVPPRTLDQPTGLWKRWIG
ncbi:MAG: hypothetical protein M1822_008875 [Bathelium mastoideum]|nr:MAG: hypothetical protein M1822_008875 [Bathelium mastoideum]